MKKLLILLFVFAIFGCEKPYSPEIYSGESDIVVEGYIENGLPPIVLLSYAQPFYSTFSTAQLGDIFIRGAKISVADEDRQIELEELYVEDLDAIELELAEKFLGFNLDSVGVNICLYTDRNFELLGEEGRVYSLEIQVGNRLLRSTTQVPTIVPLDSMWFERPSEEAQEGMMELRAIISDPVGEQNYYRYLSSVNGGPFIPGFTSVVEDAFFNGEQFTFPIPKGEPRNQTIDPKTFGFFEEGDHVVIKWSCIDESSFYFWNTLEFNEVNQGPFSSPTLIRSNIEGGLGIWSGLGVRYYTLEVR